jgi:hypothetical protein
VRDGGAAGMGYAVGDGSGGAPKWVAARDGDGGVADWDSRTAIRRREATTYER